MKPKTILLMLLTGLCIQCSTPALPTASSSLNIIPAPNEVTLKEGFCSWPSDKEPVVEIQPRHKRITAAEGYRLSINRKEVRITARTEAGAFYGRQTFLQLKNSARQTSPGTLELPCLVIEDAPRFAYRGMHLDVSRHFFDKTFIKKQLDAMAYYKFNTFHWHLTDGAGWRLEIPKYPLLTSEAAWRRDARWKDWWTTGERQYCTQDTPGAYGGYFTAEDVKEIVAYAAERHITVIPEIEMPGHSDEVLAVYPNLSCSGKPYVAGEFCIGNEDTFTFLQDVLDVVMDLFPSHYIHIGGDECNHAHWEQCPKCQALMKREGMTDVAQLQSYLITRIEKYLNDHGRDLLGWDEILDGGLAPNATVMSWRGEAGGLKAAQAGHNVVMTPGGYCYLDAYQADPETQPEAIGGFLNLEKAYSYNPCPDSMDAAIASYILGVQANVWAEYMPTYEHAEYMIYPRLLAVAEVAWTQAAKKSWPDFKLRANNAITYLQQKGYNPFPLSDRVLSQQEVHAQDGYLSVTLESERTGVEIRYALGDTLAPPLHTYNEPLVVRDSLTLVAALYRNGVQEGTAVTLHTDYHKGIGKHAVYTTRIYPDYAAGGDSALIDGYRGGSGYGDGRWQGFCPNDLDVIIDLGDITPVHRIEARFMQVVGPWIFFPSKVDVYGSQNGVDYTHYGTQVCDVPVDREGALFQNFGWTGPAIPTRFVRYVAKQSSKKAFIFTDEIVIQ